jgi:hypothetical protein
MAIPESVLSKLFRADEHLQELQKAVMSFYGKNPARIERLAEGSPDEFWGKVVCGAQIPTRIPLIIGDCLQNLRSALDYLVWELVLAAKNTPDHRSMFPICTTPESFKTQLNRHRLDGVAAGAIAEIEALQPYHDGAGANENVLATIDSLCNINKHQQILTTVFYGTQAPSDFVTKEIDGQTYALTSFESILKQGTKIGPFPIVSGPQGYFPQVENLNVIGYIAFDDGTPQNVDVGHSLSIFIGYVKQFMPTFEQCFV